MISCSWIIDLNFCPFLGFGKDILYYISDPLWKVVFSQLFVSSLDNKYMIIQTSNCFLYCEKLTKLTKKVLNPQSKSTWCFYLFHKHPCSFLIFEASILSQLQWSHRESIGVCRLTESSCIASWTQQLNDLHPRKEANWKLKERP